MPIPKEAMSILLSGFRQISITPVMSKVFDRVFSSRLFGFMETEGVFPSLQYTYRKGLETCETLLDIFFAEQAA